MRLDRARVRDLHDAVQREVDEAGLASCQYAIGLHGEVVVSDTVGDGPDDARYLLFSATKVVPVAAVWRLLAQGRLDVDAPVTTWWPGFGRHGKEVVTIEQVLTHRCGFPTADVGSEGLTDRSSRVEQMERWKLEWPPGTRSQYHAFSAHWVLAELIERVTGADHRAAVRELLLDPLHLDRLELGVPVERQHDIQALVPTGEGPTFEEVATELGTDVAQQVMPMLEHGLEPDETVLRLASPEGYAGGVPGAGAVSDARSLALLYQELLHNRAGLWDDELLREATRTVRCFDPGTIGNPAMRGLGVDIAGEGTPEERRLRLGSGHTSPRAFGHSGAGGQIAWADPDTGMSFAFLTNGWDRNPIRGKARDAALNRHAAACLV